MIISQGTQQGKIKPTNGYGYATVNMYASLDRLGYQHSPNDASADVEIWFDQPHHWKWSGTPFKIGYHPWESTNIKPDWLAAMKNCDEVWTPSPIIANWYRDLGLSEVYVYEHGVDAKDWKVKHRKVSDRIRFLHVGGEAVRKGVDVTVNAFRAAFQGRRDEVELTLKMDNPGNKIEQLGNIRWVNNLIPFDELVGLFHDHHVFVYPSWGEGFGLNPLQAMATGMPVLCTGAWAPYKRLLDPDLTIESSLVDSPWPQIHPGKMFQPNFDDLVDKMRWVADNYEDCLSDALPRAFAVRSEYDWDNLTSKAFTALEWRLFSRGNLFNPPGFRT